jgi:hypothetical protein
MEFPILYLEFSISRLGDGLVMLVARRTSSAAIWEAGVTLLKKRHEGKVLLLRRRNFLFSGQVNFSPSLALNSDLDKASFLGFLDEHFHFFLEKN